MISQLTGLPPAAAHAQRKSLDGALVVQCSAKLKAAPYLVQYVAGQKVAHVDVVGLHLQREGPSSSAWGCVAMHASCSWQDSGAKQPAGGARTSFCSSQLE